jgi:pectate lyase
MSTQRSRRIRSSRLLAIISATGLVVAAVATAQFASAATPFSANFEDGNTGSWSKSGGAWSVVSDGSRVLQQSKTTTDNARIFVGDSGWTSYTVQARVKPLALGSGGLVGLLARATSSTTFYRLALVPGNQVQLQAVNSGAVTVLGSASRTVATGTWYTLALSVNGNSISGSVDGSTIATASNTAIAKGRMGLQTRLSTANFDDVTVTTEGGSTPTPTSTSTPTPTPTSTSGPTPGVTWPTKTGDVPVTSTIPVSGTLDGGMRRYCCIGTGGQSESEDAMFELADGAVLKNVIIGSPAGDGVHCLGRCTIQNVWWEDVGEDAATFLGTNGDSYVIGGGARSAADKTFQHNGSGTVHISGFYAQNIGKLYRGCGNCTTSHQRHVVVDNVILDKAGYVVGINVNWGDTATLSRITLINGSSTHICAQYQGAPKGSEPTYLRDGVNDAYCHFTMADITYR